MTENPYQSPRATDDAAGLPEPTKAQIGFTGSRVGYVLAVFSVLLVPAHSYVSCEASSRLLGISLLVLAITLGLSLITPRSIPHRFRPVAFAFLAFVVNSLCTH